MNSVEDTSTVGVFITHDDKEYNYEIKDAILHRSPNGRDDKNIYLIRFEKEAPKGCDCDTIYVLKKSGTLTSECLTRPFPGDRTIWDFVDFNGEHLRKILAKNKDAHVLQQNLNQNGAANLFLKNDKDSYNCEIIEPYYESFVKKNEHSGCDECLFDNLTDIQKIDCIMQIVQAVEELRRNKIKIREDEYAEIISHRDIKFNNVLYTVKDGEYKYILIDYPSIKIKGYPTILKDSFEKQDLNCDSLCATSVTNTTPEHVLSDYAIDQQTDVFALAMMLAQIFDVYKKGRAPYQNPLYLFFEAIFDEFKVKYGNNLDTALGDTKYFRDVYNDVCNKVRDKKLGEHTWLDNRLFEKNKFVSSLFLKVVKKEKWPTRYGKRLETLFYQSISFHPTSRPKLEEFRKELDDIKKNLSSNFEPIYYNLICFDTTNLDDETKKVYSKNVSIIQDDLYNKNIKTYACCFEDAYMSEIFEDPLYETDSLIAEEQDLDSVDDVKTELEALKKTSKKHITRLSCNLLTAHRLLKGNNENTDFRFNGEVYVFTPFAPIKRDLMPLKDEYGNQIDWGIILSGLKIHIYHIGPKSSEEYEWYTSHPIVDIGKNQGSGLYIYEDGKYS